MTQGRIGKPTIGVWRDADGDTAIPAPNAGGGALTARLPMTRDEAVRLYREERTRRWARILGDD